MDAMADLRAFYLALPDEHKQSFLQSLRGALQTPGNSFSGIANLQFGIERSTVVPEEIRENAIQATKGLAGYPMSDLNSYLDQLSNAEQGNSEGGSSLSLADNLSIDSQETVSSLGGVEGLSSSTDEDVSVEKSTNGRGCSRSCHPSDGRRMFVGGSDFY